MISTQPVLFVPHGAPTFALRPGATGAALTAAARALDRPRAIVIISAHWDTATPTVGFADRPDTIHDFGGFRKSFTRCVIRPPAAAKPLRRSSPRWKPPGWRCRPIHSAALIMEPGFRCG